MELVTRRGRYRDRGTTRLTEVVVLERRKARRFRVGWDVTVTATDSGGSHFAETGKLENLSSSGAFLYLTRHLEPGTIAEVSIRVPFQRENWMKYSGEVVRSEAVSSRIGIAMRFEGARPAFEVESSMHRDRV